MQQVPEEIKHLKQWINYHSPTDKRPIPSNYNDKSTHMDFATAYAKRSYIGFVPYKDNEIALLDFDHRTNFKDMPDDFKDWLRSSKPYCEYSPSGQGIRVIVKVPVSFKQEVGKAYCKAKEFDGQIGLHTNYQTITGRTIANFVNLVEIPIGLVKTLFNIATEQLPETEASLDMFDGVAHDVPDVTQVESILETLPINQSDQIKMVYKRIFKEEYEHYAYWTYIGMALYDWGERVNSLATAFQAYDNWSGKDEVAYTGSDDVYTHWKSFESKRDDRITYKTLNLLASHFRLTWPIPKAVKNSKQPPQPAIQEYRNFDYLMNDFLGIRLIKDSMKTGEYYVKGNKEICQRHVVNRGANKLGDMYGPISTDSMCFATYEICQDHQYRNLVSSINKHNTAVWLSKVKKSTNIIRYWLDTAFDDLPQELQINGDQNSRFRDLLDCIQYSPIHKENTSFYEAILTKAFMGWLKLYYYNGPFGLNNMVPILSGPENCRKSTFIRLLLPQVLADKYITGMSYDLKSPASVRDANRLTSGHAFIEWGEVDRFLSDEISSTFKDFVSTDTFSATDKYDKHETKFKKHALLIGTTNSNDLILSREGTRRTPILPVQFIDTDKLANLNLHAVYCDLRDNIYTPAILNRKPDEPMPWILTENEIGAVEDLNVDFRAETNLAIALQELFDFSQPFKGLVGVTDLQRDETHQVMKISTIKSLLERSGNPKISMAHLRRELKSLLGRYTGTTKEVGYNYPFPIYQGATWIGEGKSKKSYWAVPPLAQQIDIM